MKKAFENIVGKGENAGITRIFSFSTMSSTFPKPNIFFIYIYLPSANAFNLDRSKILSFGKELTVIANNEGENHFHNMARIIDKNFCRFFLSLPLTTQYEVCKPWTEAI